MNTLRVLVCVALLPCAGCRPPHAGQEPARIALEQTLRLAAQDKAYVLPLGPGPRNRPSDGTEFWCMQGGFEIRFVDDFMGEYIFEVTYPKTASKVLAYVFEDGWFFHSYKLTGVEACKSD